MIRKIFLSAVILAVCLPSAYAKKEKTVIQEDTVLTDTQYGYSMVVNSNWKVKSFKEPSIERAFLEKKNYSVNAKVKTYGGDYTIPTIVLYAQEFSGTPEDFEALLKKSLDEHNSDNPIISKLGLLRDGEYVISGDALVDSLPARQIVLKRNYKRVLASDAYGRSSQTSGETETYINDHEIHEIFLVKKADIMYVFQAFCEREFYGKENKDEFEAMVASWRFM